MQRHIEQTLRELKQYSEPSSDEEILVTLKALADTFQVEIPEADGLEMYVAALRSIPRPAFLRARELLVLRHKWPRLPYPADFIEAGADLAKHLDQIRSILMYHRRKIIAARKILRARRT